MAAVLEIVKGANQGQRVNLEGDRFTLGRNPDCHVVIPITSVSREHAHILRVDEKYFIEDLQSRNGTKVNNQNISGRTQLKDSDKIQICDFIASFRQPSAAPKAPLPQDMARTATFPEPAEPEEDDNAPVPEATINTQSSNQLLQAQPAEKLKALLDISNALGKTLELDALLPKILEHLFTLFKQADRGFLIQRDEASGRLIPKVIKTRRTIDDSNARFSRSIVKQCMDTTQAFLLDDASSDQRFALSQSVADFRIRSVMCAPLLTSEGKAVGVLQLDTQDRGKKFTADDLNFLFAVASQASVSLENAKLHESSLTTAKIKRDLELAHQVQLSFLPNQLPQIPGYEFYAFYESALEVGGDYYDFIPLAGGKLVITVGDVAGKGVPASLLMAKLSSDARFSCLTEPALGVAVGQLNNRLYEHTSKMDRFVTLGAALLDPATHTVTLASAGHPSPLLYRRAEGTLEEAVPRRVSGTPLGMLEGMEFDTCQVTLGPGDFLMLFSDGVPDSHSLKNVPFNMAGVYTALEQGKPHTPKSAGERVTKAVKQHATGRSPHDDVTMVCFGRCP